MFMIRNVIEPELIQGHDLLPDSGLLSSEYRQKGRGTIDRCCLLIVRQDLWHSSEMTRDKPEFLRESPIYHGLW
jgi:hypothetical protein